MNEKRSGKKCNPHYVRNDIQYCKVVKYDWVNARVYKIMFWDITTAQKGQNISKVVFEFYADFSSEKNMLGYS